MFIINHRNVASLALAVALSACGQVYSAQDSSTIVLPAPQLLKGRPLMQVLKDRKSSRAFSDKKLSTQEFANLLWAAFGINRPETGGRTAPSAMNMQETDLYVTMAEGLFLYDAKAHALKKIDGKDMRALTGGQPFVKEAAANILLVANLTRMRGSDRNTKIRWAGMDAAYISQNIYLYCASEGLATVVRGSVGPQLAKAMQLSADQEVVLAQDVGYPK
jgi:SagB-type dehydrogenase family enzyme